MYEKSIKKVVIQDTDIWSLEFKNIAQGIQAILISLAAIIGSIWAIFRFKATKEVEKARLELDRMKIDTQTYNGVEINLDIYHKKVKNKFIVYFTLELLNLNKAIQLLKCYENPFEVHKATIEDGLIRYHKIADSKIFTTTIYPGNHEKSYIEMISLYPNTPKSVYHFYEVHSKGNYVFTFRFMPKGFDLKSQNDIRKFQLFKENFKKSDKKKLNDNNDIPDLFVNKYYYVD